MEEEVGFVHQAHVCRLLAGCKHLPAHVKRPHLDVLAGSGGVRLALVVRHHLVPRRPHAQVVDHLRRRQSASTAWNGWAAAAATRLYLSHVLVGGQDDLVESRGRDLDSLLEGDGHHGSLDGDMKQCFENTKFQLSDVIPVENTKKINTAGKNLSIEIF